MADHDVTPTAEPAPARKNPALGALVWLGLLAVIGGAIGAFSAKSSADYDADVDALTRALIADDGGWAGDWRDVTADYTTVWVFVGVAVLGILMLIAALVVKAARR